MTALLLGINWGGLLHPWDSAPTIVPIVLGVFGPIGFWLYEAFMSLKALPLCIHATTQNWLDGNYGCRNGALILARLLKHWATPEASTSLLMQGKPYL